MATNGIVICNASKHRRHNICCVMSDGPTSAMSDFFHFNFGSIMVPSGAVIPSLIVSLVNLMIRYFCNRDLLKVDATDKIDNWRTTVLFNSYLDIEKFHFSLFVCHLNQFSFEKILT